MEDRVVICIRVDPDLRERLADYGADYDLTTNDIITSLIQQLLTQVDETYDPPPELIGRLPRPASRRDQQQLELVR